MTDATQKRFQSGREVLQHFIPGYRDAHPERDYPPSHDLIEDDGLRLAEGLLESLKEKLKKTDHAGSGLTTA